MLNPSASEPLFGYENGEKEEDDEHQDRIWPWQLRLILARLFQPGKRRCYNLGVDKLENVGASKCWHLMKVLQTRWKVPHTLAGSYNQKLQSASFSVSWHLTACCQLYPRKNTCVQHGQDVSLASPSDQFRCRWTSILSREKLCRYQFNTRAKSP